MKVEIKVTQVDSGGFIVKTYDKEADQRVPMQTLVAEDLTTMGDLVKELFQTPTEAKCTECNRLESECTCYPDNYDKNS